MKLDKFTQAYIECALWSSTDDKDEPMDSNYGMTDLSDSALNTMVDDCESFQRDNEETLAKWYSECGESEERAGHDFWLTRNGHGAGYWARWNGGTPQAEVGRKLTYAAEVYGSCDLYVGDDKQVYAQ